MDETLGKVVCSIMNDFVFCLFFLNFSLDVDRQFLSRLYILLTGLPMKLPTWSQFHTVERVKRNSLGSGAK